MLKIRLMRTGRKKLPSYRVIVANSRTKRDGKAIAFLGSYSPITKRVSLKMDLVDKYIAYGAQPTETAAALIKKCRVAN